VLPGTQTDGKANTLTEDVQFTTRALARVTGTLRYYGYKYDNQTPEWAFPGYVRVDAVAEPAVTSEPFGNEQKTFGADVDVDPTDRVTVGATYERQIRDHSLREVEKNTEDIVAVRGKAHPIDQLTLDARYRHGDRKLDTFDVASYQASETDTTLTEQPGLRRYDVADRKQDDARAVMGLALGERVQVDADYGYLKNDYQNSQYGLQREEQNRISAEGTFHAHEQLDLHLGYGYTQLISVQKSNESNSSVVTADAATDWTADIKDLNNFFFAGFDVDAVPKKVTLSGRYEYTRDFAAYRLDNTANTAVDVPSTRYQRYDATLELSWRARKDFEVSGRYGWEEFDVDDFSAEGVPALSTAANGSLVAIYLGDFYQDYRAHRVALLVKHWF
jgi:hypothetical protein